jgi:hypothetical protein
MLLEYLFVGVSFGTKLAVECARCTRCTRMIDKFVYIVEDFAAFGARKLK